MFSDVQEAVGLLRFLNFFLSNMNLQTVTFFLKKIRESHGELEEYTM